MHSLQRDDDAEVRLETFVGRNRHYDLTAEERERLEYLFFVELEQPYDMINRDGEMLENPERK